MIISQIACDSERLKLNIAQAICCTDNNRQPWYRVVYPARVERQRILVTKEP